jgi:hypothetical protein
MKNLSKVCCFLAISIVLLTGLTVAGEKATKEECVAKSKEAAKMIQEKGLDVALETLNSKEGPFVWKDSYVFCVEEETARLLASPVVPKRIIGVSMKDYMDPDGKKIFQEFLELAKTKGEGWVDYLHAKKPGETPLQKTSYIYKVPGENVIVGAGVYE